MELSSLSIKEYSSLLASKKSAPGGGSALALVSELACDLVLMVINFTVDKPGYEDVREEVLQLKYSASIYKDQIDSLIDKDVEAYNAVMAAYKSKDEAQIKQASYQGCLVPYQLYVLTTEVEKLARRIAEIGNVNLVSDALIALNLTKAVYPGCIDNIKCNIAGVEDSKKGQFLSLIE